MATWFTIYSKRPVRGVTLEKLQAHLRGPKLDWYSLAESFGIEDEAEVERAVDALQVTSAVGVSGEWYQVRYKPSRFRPLLVYLWSDPARLKQELAETQENFLVGRKGRGVSQVREALANVVEVAAVELGLSQMEDMGLVLAGQVAEYLAGVGEGVIRDTGDEWWAVKQGCAQVTPRKLLNS